MVRSHEKLRSSNTATAKSSAYNTNKQFKLIKAHIGDGINYPDTSNVNRDCDQ